VSLKIDFEVGGNLQRSLIPVGWVSRKHLYSGRGRSFFLTSLLIELIDLLYSLSHSARAARTAPNMIPFQHRFKYGPTSFA
jgi:hypothetical protein